MIKDYYCLQIDLEAVTSKDYSSRNTNSNHNVLQHPYRAPEWETSQQLRSQPSVQHTPPPGDNRRRMKTSKKNHYGLPKQQLKTETKQKKDPTKQLPNLKTDDRLRETHTRQIEPVREPNFYQKQSGKSDLREQEFDYQSYNKNFAKKSFGNALSILNPQGLFAVDKKEICQRYLMSDSVFSDKSVVFEETRYAYAVNGLPGNSAQTSAAAAFFAR